MTRDDLPGDAGRRSWGRGVVAALPWVGLAAIGLFWGMTVLGIAIALADKGAAAWWVVLIFGALPLIGLYRIAERLAHRRSGAPRAHAPAEIGSGRREAAPDEPSRAPASVPGEPVVVEDLTNREREVLALLDKGRTNGEIARELYVSTGTVKSHVNSIFRKLGARNRTEAVAQARRLDLIL